jgi:Family of unknown function (DUF6994)
MGVIDTSFDMRSDAGDGDPDSDSPTLRRYHQLLWSKPLPNGATFELDTITPRTYLHHDSALGEFWLSSDSVIQTFIRWASTQQIISQLSDDEVESFYEIGYTIGGMMIFPSNKIDGMMTINGARGFNRSISDRFDLTVECIRRHYLGKSNPLDAVLDRYGDFFGLFDTFHGYVDFYMLQDIVSDDYRHVKFFMPFDDFQTAAVPRDVETYREFRRRSIDFVVARNLRIDRATITTG